MWNFTFSHFANYFWRFDHRGNPTFIIFVSCPVCISNTLNLSHKWTFYSNFWWLETLKTPFPKVGHLTFFSDMLHFHTTLLVQIFITWRCLSDVPYNFVQLENDPFWPNSRCRFVILVITNNFCQVIISCDPTCEFILVWWFFITYLKNFELSLFFVDMW